MSEVRIPKTCNFFLRSCFIRVSKRRSAIDFGWRRCAASTMRLGIACFARLATLASDTSWTLTTPYETASSILCSGAPKTRGAGEKIWNPNIEARNPKQIRNLKKGFRTQQEHGISLSLVEREAGTRNELKIQSEK